MQNALIKEKNLNKAEFKTCFDLYFDAIRNFIYYKSGDSELATDICQDVFLKVWEKKIEYRTEAIKGLLYKMANDRFINQIRRDKVANKYKDTIDLRVKNNISPQDTLEYNELKGRYEEALAELPEKQREVFLMSRLEGLTYREIAERLDISQKAVEKRMSNALSKLKKIIVLLWITITII